MLNLFNFFLNFNESLNYLCMFFAKVVAIRKVGPSEVVTMGIVAQLPLYGNPSLNKGTVYRKITTTFVSRRFRIVRRLFGVKCEKRWARLRTGFKLTHRAGFRP